ncbi:MAG: hypothetical protein NTY95_05350 [Bacteroidia bacterium]|nr:hypothetical protein [Bacteroidia bacterium]
MEETNRMKKHVTVVGAIHIGFGFIGLIGALGAFFALNFAKGVVGNDEIPSMVLGFLSISVPLLIGFLSTLGLIGGIGLLSFQSWARYLVIVVAALGCLNIPIGTLKGVYSLWVLLQEDTIKLFNGKRATQ